MRIELTHNALSTLLIDCIQYYPDKRSYKETHGLIMGLQEKNCLTGEYTFPVGNVKARDRVSVTPNPKVDEVVKQTKELVATTACIAAYHSHPYDDFFPEWAMPSNEDCHAIIGSDIKAELIVAIRQNKVKNQPLCLSYMKENGLRYNCSDHEFPDIEDLGYTTQYIHGSFLNYDFEIRAYLNTGERLQDMDLYSSETALNELFTKENINIADLPSQAMYSVRKLEYALRQQNEGKYSDKISYHLQKIKSSL